MSWNIVFDEFIKLKHLFLDEMSLTKTTSLDKIYTFNEEDHSCVYSWIDTLLKSNNNSVAEFGKEFLYKIQPLKLNQYNNLLLIKYDLLKVWPNTDIKEFWNLYDGFYREARSLVIDLENEEMVLTPFKKFCNLNENAEYSIDNVQKRIKNAKTIEVTDKLDGSMCSARSYNGNIVLSSSGTLNKKKSSQLTGMYEMVKNSRDILEMLTAYPDFTFIFEYIAFNDAHVVSYNEEGLFLIGIRNVITGEEYPYSFVCSMAKKYEINTTVVENISFEEALSSTDKYSSNQKEGWVINIDGWKCKLKCSDYLNSALLLNELASENLIIRAVYVNQYDDLYSKLPPMQKNRINKIYNKIVYYENLYNQVVDYCYDKAPKSDRKSYMIWIQKNAPSVIFGALVNKYLHKDINPLSTKGSDVIKMSELNKNLDVLYHYAKKEGIYFE